jgi:hypothetical protein
MVTTGYRFQISIAVFAIVRSIMKVPPHVQNSAYYIILVGAKARLNLGFAQISMVRQFPGGRRDGNDKARVYISSLWLLQNR